MQSRLLSSYSTIRHIFTTRHGGVSSAPYNSYNLALILPKHIENVNLCTSCQHETFFSYRADSQQTGRMAGVIMLKSEDTESKPRIISELF